VRRFLSDVGRTQRCRNIDDVRAALPDELRETCTILATARRGRRGRPVGTT